MWRLVEVKPFDPVLCHSGMIVGYLVHKEVSRRDIGHRHKAYQHSEQVVEKKTAAAEVGRTIDFWAGIPVGPQLTPFAVEKD